MKNSYQPGVDRETILEMLRVAAGRGAYEALKETGGKPTIRKAEAYRIYGRSNVDRWIHEKLLTPISVSGGSSTNAVLDRQQLQIIAGNSNRITYLPTADR
jgi:hypothetical protein